MIKKIIHIMLLAPLFMACSHEDGVEEQAPANSNEQQATDNGGQTTDNGGQPTDTLGVAAARPTDWQVVCQVDPTTSMTLTIEVVGLPQEVGENDLMASFVGDECRGVTKPLTSYLPSLNSVPELSLSRACRGEGQHTITRFYLPVARSVNDNPDVMPQVCVRYYSATAGRVYTMQDNLLFQNDGRIGTPTQPFIPVWK